MRRNVLRAIVLMPESVGIAAFLVGGDGCWASRLASLSAASFPSMSMCGVKWVYTRAFERSKYQLFCEGIDPGRPEEAYEVCLTHREVSLSDMVLIYQLL